MLAESKQLETEINSLRLQLSKLPEGKLVFSHTGKYTKWYWRNQKNKILIPKSNRPFAEALATKNYLSARLDELILEKKTVDFYLKHYSIDKPLNSQELLKRPDYQDLLSSNFSPSSLELIEWSNFPYEKNLQFPEQLIHRTSSGNLVRSKSEALIDTLLTINKIPFRYECALHIADLTFYPDFTIVHPTTEKIYYWEHFGLMDDPVYCKKAYSKLHFYTSQGIIPSHQLITTFETKDHPLDSEYVSHLITHHLLN